MLDQDAALKAVQLLADNMFYRDPNRRIYRAMEAIVDRGDVLDPVILRDELARRADLEAAGGMDYLAELLDVIPTAANIEFHCRIVKDKALLRRLIEVGTGLVQAAYDGRKEVGALLDDLRKATLVVALALAEILALDGG